MKYKALPRECEIDPEVALLQSAKALDAAAVKAELLNDVEGLLSVAALWIKFAQTISGIAEQMEDVKDVPISKSETKFEVGFQGLRPDPEHINAGEDENG